MEKDIFELIRSLVDFDGDKYSLFEKGKDTINKARVQKTTLYICLM